MNPEPVTLVYAPVSRAHWIFTLHRRLPWKWIVPLLAVMLIAAGGYFTLDYGSSSYSCANCGARMTDHVFSIFCNDWRYHINVNEGPVSQFMQTCNGKCQVHQWEMADLSHRQMGATGRGFGRFKFVAILESFPSELEKVLARRTKQESGFAIALTKAVRSGDDKELQESLMDETWDMREIAGK